jgi:hypothetical protein
MLVSFKLHLCTSSSLTTKNCESYMPPLGGIWVNSFGYISYLSRFKSHFGYYLALCLLVEGEGRRRFCMRKRPFRGPGGSIQSVFVMKRESSNPGGSGIWFGRSSKFIWAPCRVMYTAVLTVWDPATPLSPIPPRLDSHTNALLVSQDWRNLFMTLRLQ